LRETNLAIPISLGVAPPKAGFCLPEVRRETSHQDASHFANPDVFLFYIISNATFQKQFIIILIHKQQIIYFQK